MSKSRILLVDDEPSITAALKISLRKEPWEVLTAASGAAGLALLEQQPAAVVVSDERMPGMNGAEFLAEVGKRWPLTIRMMLTGQATLGDAMQASPDSGIWRYFLKPIPAADLRLSIAKAVEHHELLCESRRLLETARRGEERSSANEPVEPMGQRHLLDELKAFNSRTSMPASTPVAAPAARPVAAPMAAPNAAPTPSPAAK